MIKETIREAMLQIRNDLLEEKIVAAKKNILDQIAKDKNFKKAKVVGLYYPILNEVDIIDLIRKFPDKTYCLPKLHNNQIYYYHYNDLTPLVKGEFGVMEPKIREDLTKQLEYVLVPCVAINHEGYRLGYGKGYFDRFFIKRQPMIKVGVAYYFGLIDFQAKTYDSKLDYYFLG